MFTNKVLEFFLGKKDVKTHPIFTQEVFRVLVKQKIARLEDKITKLEDLK